MHWADKQQRINPIPSGVEIKLLTRALNTQPRNPLLFSKLIEALVLENKLRNAIELCERHLKIYHQDDHVYAALIYLYRKTSNTDALIKTGELALQYSAKLETQLYLAYAYAQEGRTKEAAQTLSSISSCLTLAISHLRLMLETLLRIDQVDQICQIYRALPPSKQQDSGLKSYYLKALHQLGLQTEIDSIIDHQAQIIEHHLLEWSSQRDISDLNRQLKSFFLSHSQQHYEPGNHTTRHGSQLYFESHWHQSLLELEDQIKRSVERYICEHEAYQGVNDHSFSLNLWANILGNKGHQISHIHPEALVSGVYYVSVPESIKQASQPDNRQGFLLFSQPETNNNRYIQPREGLIVLFPSYLYHETLPLEYEETRICVAFDVICEDDRSIK